MRAQTAFAALYALLLLGCTALHKDGVYKGDAILFRMDVSITGAFDILEAFVTWEYKNRAIINNADVKNYADSIRRSAPLWRDTAMALRDSYKVNPNDKTKQALELSVSILTTAATEATKYMTEVK